MRQAFPPERIVAMAEALAEGAESEQVRLSALQLISERAHGKVTDRHEVSVGGAQDDDLEVDLSLLSDEQLDRLEQLERERDELLSGVAPLALPTGAGPLGVGAK